VSRSWAGGSTRAWRRLRAYVLDRDGYACQVPVDAAGDQVEETLAVRRCLAYAHHAGHVIAKCEGGPDTPENLRATCARHNLTEGAGLGARRRRRSPAQPRGWNW
jgi:5-methylcytosine-specific restriction endonuclease McrA